MVVAAQHKQQQEEIEGQILRVKKRDGRIENTRREIELLVL